jgi:hypothetical protein
MSVADCLSRSRPGDTVVWDFYGKIKEYAIGSISSMGQGSALYLNCDGAIRYISACHYKHIAKIKRNVKKR